MHGLEIIIAMNANPKKYSRGLGMTVHQPIDKAPQARISGNLNGVGSVNKNKKTINKRKNDN